MAISTEVRTSAQHGKGLRLMKTYSEIVGDGGSNVVEQILTRQAEIRRRLSGVQQVLLIGSGKGGVGKSTVTMQLALALHLIGKKVGVLDADFNGPSLARFFGLNERSPFPGPDGLLPPATKDGIHLVSYGSFLNGDTSLEFESTAKGDAYVWRQTKEFSVFAELLSQVDWGKKDFLLVDLPPGPERTAHFADFFVQLKLPLEVLLVSLPTTISREVVQRSIAALLTTGIDIRGYVENMSGYYCKDCQSVRPLFPERQSSLTLPLLGSIPFDAELALACETGVGCDQFLNFPSTRQVQELAKTMINKQEHVH